MREAGFDLPPFDFSVPGVTSISADTHKVLNHLLGRPSFTRQTPSAEATARAQCASPTDLKVDRTSLKLWQNLRELGRALVDRLLE